MVQYAAGDDSFASFDVAPDADVDAYALLHERVPELKGLTRETFPNFMSLLAAAMRGAELHNENPYLNDMYAEPLADTAREFMKLFPAIANDQESMGYAVLRHRLIDDEIEESLNPDIHQVVYIGSGMDSRSYRLQRYADCHVFELDSCEELAVKKQQTLKELNAKLIPKKHDVIITDFSKEQWPEELISHGFEPSKPTLWIVEALLQYLDEPSIHRLFATIDSLSAPKSQVLGDMTGTGAIKVDIIFVNGRLTFHGDTQDQKKEIDVLANLPWKNEYLLYRTPDGEYSGRRWDPVKFSRYHTPKDKLRIGRWFVMSCVKPDVNETAP